MPIPVFKLVNFIFVFFFVIILLICFLIGNYTVINLLPNFSECGASIEDRLFRGKTIDLNEFPWTALLEYEHSTTLFF